jgi:diguanylate cyclase (GGDEF)-like protein
MVMSENAALNTPSCALLGSVLGAVGFGLIVLDDARRIVLWNDWMAQYSDCPSGRAQGRDLFALFPELSGKRIDGAVRQALADNFRSVLSQTLHKAPLPLYADAVARAAASRIQQAIAITPLNVDGGARHCLIQVTDVSLAVQRERLLRGQAIELRSQSYSDGLTGIANRRHFDVAMERELRRAKRAGTPLSLLMIDIDYFKAYNDHYGHQQGDDTLIRVAATLGAMLQRPLDLIARYGGEEFGVILPEMSGTDAARLAEAMRRTIESLAIAHAAGAGQVTISIGLATRAPDHPVEVAALIFDADRALYAAKRDGRNRVARQGHATPA